MRKPRKWEVVRVRWMDAVTHYDPTHSDDEDTNKPSVRYSAGHLIAFNRRNGITVAMEDDREMADLLGTGTDCQTKTTIPFGMIERVTVYPEKETPFVAYERARSSTGTRRKASASAKAAGRRGRRTTAA